MSRFYSYINTATRILGQYQGDTPLVHYLRKYFGQHKAHGSKDRKLISALCYDFFRAGKVFKDMPVAGTLPYCWFLTEKEDPGFLNELPLLKEKIAAKPEEKLQLLKLSPADIFEYSAQLSEEVDPVSYSTSLLIQPDLFLRSRPGKGNLVQQKLQEANLGCTREGESAFRLANATRLTGIIELDKEAVVQDLNSQKTLDAIPADKLPGKIEAWDCCAASGGKSILLYDRLNGKVQLTVSDIRESILANLKERFRHAGIKNYTGIVHDLQKNALPSDKLFDVIICDAPCTGSGTWARTPEQYFYFKPSTIADYAARQLSISSNALKKLSPGGEFYYITCSVFKEENEAIVSKLLELENVKLLRQQYLAGYNEKADTLFVAVLTNRSSQ